MTYDAVDGYVLMFGGDANGAALNDTWVFTHGGWTQLHLAVHPGARTEAMMAYDDADQYALLWGGYNTTSFADQSDTWEFAGGQWNAISPANGTKPIARHSASMTYERGDREVVLFGGFRQSLLVTLNDTWTYHAGSWEKVHSSGSVPSPREQAAFVFDPAANVTTLMGGDSVLSVLDDLWSYDRGNWTLLHPARLPSSRTEASMVSDPSDGYLLLFGGNRSVPNGPELPLADSWSAGPNFTTSLEADHPVIDVGQKMSLYARAVANGTTSFAYGFGVLPPGCTASYLPVVTCNVTRVGNYTVAVNVTASWGSFTNVSIARTELSVEPLPVIRSLTATPQVLDYLQRFTIVLQVAGGTGVERYSYSGTPSNCPSFNVTELNCTVDGPVPPGGFPHIYRVNATVTDSLGGRNMSSVDVTVNPDPAVQPGTFAASPPATDVGYVTDFISNVTGGTGPLTYAYSGLPAGCISENLSVLPCRPTTNGSFAVNLTVTDSRGFVSIAVESILQVNLPPAISTVLLDPAIVDVGGSFTVATLVNNGTGAFTFAYAGLPSGCANSARPSFTCAPTSSGTYTIRVTATDNVGASATMSARLQVWPDPLIESFTSSSYHVDWNQTFTLAVVASGGAGPLAVSYLGLPSGCLSQNLTSINCSTTDRTPLGPYVIRVSIKDGLGWLVGADVRVEISTDPAIESFTATPSAIALGDSTTISLVLAGGSGGPRYSYSGLPSGCFGNASPQFPCTPSVSGSFQLSARATDLANYTVSASTRLLVNASLTGGGASGPVGGLPPIIWMGGVGTGLVAAVISGFLIRNRRQRGERSPGPDNDAPSDESGVGDQGLQEYQSEPAVPDSGDESEL